MYQEKSLGRCEVCSPDVASRKGVITKVEIEDIVATGKMPRISL